MEQPKLNQPLRVLFVPTNMVVGYFIVVAVVITDSLQQDSKNKNHKDTTMMKKHKFRTNKQSTMTTTIESEIAKIVN